MRLSGSVGNLLCLNSYHQRRDFRAFPELHYTVELKLCLGSWVIILNPMDCSEFQLALDDDQGQQGASREWDVRIRVWSTVLQFVRALSRIRPPLVIVVVPTSSKFLVLANTHPGWSFSRSLEDKMAAGHIMATECGPHTQYAKVCRDCL